MSLELGPVINLKSWIDAHRHLLQGPVKNKLVFEEQGFFIMIVGGPNIRSDFHINAGAELFYQFEGVLTLRTIQDAVRKDIKIGPEEIFQLPPGIPHSPQRPEGSVGLVVERRRNDSENDGLAWYCEGCNHLLYEEYFKLKNIEADFPPVFERFYSSDYQTCSCCGWKLELSHNYQGPNTPHEKNRHPHSYSS